MAFPETEGFAYSFAYGELSAGPHNYTLISNVEIDQPTAEAAVYGTSANPLRRTMGQAELGNGVVGFSDGDDFARFLRNLGPAYREVAWSLAWQLQAPGLPNIKIECFRCRVTSTPISHSQGEGALEWPVNFSFLSHKINGQEPHRGMTR